MPVEIFLVPGMIAFIFAFYKGYKQFYRNENSSLEDEW